MKDFTRYVKAGTKVAISFLASMAFYIAFNYSQPEQDARASVWTKEIAKMKLPETENASSIKSSEKAMTIRIDKPQIADIQINIHTPIGPFNVSDGANFDERLYNTMIKYGASSMLELSRIHTSWSSAVANSLGTNNDGLWRIFSMMHLGKANMHRQEYAYLLQPKDCASDFKGTLIFVINMPKHKSQRELARDTWGRELTASSVTTFRILFIMGTVDGFRDAEPLAQESRKFGDMLFVDFEENYYNLTLKSIIMIRWTMLHCPSAKFLVKVDDDVYVKAKSLETELSGRLTLNRSVLGLVSTNFPVIRNRNSKWYLPVALYPNPVIPSFAHGPCYILTVDLLSDLHEASKATDYLPLEDVFVTDLCARAAGNVTMVNIPTFISLTCGNTLAVAYHWVRC